jgi:ATP-dependent exoDNAse (exonuclease V) beta subunit
VLKQKAVIFEAIKKLAQSLPEGLNANAKKSINRFLEEDHYFKLERIPFAFRDAEPPLNKNKSAVISFLKQWKHTHNLIHHLVELDAVVTYNPYIKLFHKMLELFQHISKQEDILFLEELNQKARLLFSDGVSIAEVYYRMATRFSHYLIDEFQDTSVLQWRNIEAMVEEGLSCGGSLFYVGDKKQAIYRFRGGEAELFDEIKQKFESRYQTIPYALRKNWRSQRIIVEFNNKVFSPTNLKEAFHRMKIHEHIGSSTDAITHIFKVFEGCEQEYKQQNSEGYVKVERIEANNKEERNGLVKAKLLPLIDELCNTQGFSYKDIAILCRDNEEVELITSWLLETQMPVESEKTLNIKENHLIKEIISFLHFLYSPIDELNFSSFILGEIFSAATGISHNEITGFIFNLNSKRDKETDFTLYRSFRNNYPKIWQTYFEEFFKSVGFVSTYELLVSVYECFAIMERFPQSQAFFMKFLELVKIKEEDYIDLGEFLEYLDDAPQEDLYVTVVETDSTHVLTIHKSKGLEFGVVILPFLYIEITPETGGKNTNSYIPDTKCGPLRLLRITQEHMKYSKNLAEIYQAAYLKAFIDELNNIYVALTRPKFELYIFIPRKIGQRTNSVCYLIPEGISELGKRQSYSKEAKEHRPLERLTPSKYEDWLKFVKDEFGDPRNLQNRENILFGNIAHAALSYIKNLSGQNKNIVIDLAIDNIRTIYPFVKDFTTVKEKVAQLIEKEKISPFFYISEGTVYIEKEVVSSSGSTKRIDRLIVKEKEVWIVDYKSSKEAREEHLQQLADYIGIIQEIYPKRVVDGFIVYLDDFSVEKVNI